jgi:hypothetical protein
MGQLFNSRPLVFFRVFCGFLVALCSKTLLQKKEDLTKRIPNAGYQIHPHQCG